MKIENVALEERASKSGINWPDLWTTVGKLDIGQSVAVVLDARKNTNVSSGLTAIGYATGKKFVTKQEGEKIRIGRVK